LSWEDEDAERARLRTEYDAVIATDRVADRWGYTATGTTYGDRWRAMDVPQRIRWLNSGELQVSFYRGAPLCGEDGLTYSGGVNLVLNWTGEDEPDGWQAEQDRAYWAGFETRKEEGK
jgi:hypothetical protein